MFQYIRISYFVLSSVVFIARGSDNHLKLPCCVALAKVLPGKVFTSGQQQYTDSLDSYYSGQEGDLTPSCIVAPVSTAEVSKAVKVLSVYQLASTGSCEFAVRGGGHTPYAGSANIQAGVTIDLAALNSITVDDSQGKTSVGPGVLWGQVYTKLDSMQLSVLGGRSNLVGVAGLSLGGGISFFSGRYGLVCDNILNYEIVLADGRIINANGIHNVDLRNALRGGSNNFGIVTRFDYATFRQGNIWGGDVLYDFSTLPQQLRAFVDFGNDSNYDEYSALFQVFGAQNDFFFILNNPIYTKPTPNPPTFKRFLDIQPQLSNTARIAPLHELTNSTSSAASMGLRNMFITTTFANDLSFLQWLAPAWQNFSRSIAMVEGIQNVLLNQHLVPKMLQRAASRGGNSLGLDPSRTVVICLLSLTWTNAADDGRVRKAATAFIRLVEKEAKIRGVYDPFVYLNYADEGQRVIDGYGAISKARLRAVSRKYDPSGVFQKAVPGGFKLW